MNNLAPSGGSPSDKLDELYRGPLASFTERRNGLAKSLKASGDAAGAEIVHALKKPSLSAWAVNQLFWHHRVQFDALLHAGDQLRAAEHMSLTNGDTDHIDEARKMREQALVQARKTIGDCMRDGSHSLGATIERRIATSLEAIASYGSQNPEPVNGRLSDDLDPPGFAALAALAPIERVQPKEPAQPVSTTQGEELRAEPAETPDIGELEVDDAEQQRLDAIRKTEKQRFNTASTLNKAEKTLEKRKAQHADAERARALAETHVQEATSRLAALDEVLVEAETQYREAKAAMDSVAEQLDTLKK